MEKISWNTEPGSSGTWDSGLCTPACVASGVGGALSAFLCMFVWADEEHPYCRWPVMLGCGSCFITSVCIFCVSVSVTRPDCCCCCWLNTVPCDYTGDHVSGYLLKTGRMWQKTGCDFRGHDSEITEKKLKCDSKSTQPGRRRNTMSKQEVCQFYHDIIDHNDEFPTEVPQDFFFFKCVSLSKTHPTSQLGDMISPSCPGSFSRYAQDVPSNPNRLIWLLSVHRSSDSTLIPSLFVWAPHLISKADCRESLRLWFPAGKGWGVLSGSGRNSCPKWSSFKYLWVLFTS